MEGHKPQDRLGHAGSTPGSWDQELKSRERCSWPGGLGFPGVGLLPRLREALPHCLDERGEVGASLVWHGVGWTAGKPPNCQEPLTKDGESPVCWGM